VNRIEPAVHFALAASDANGWIDDGEFHPHERLGTDEFRIKEESQIRRVHITVRHQKGVRKQLGKRSRDHRFSCATLTTDNREPYH
jgi:hypothetical protein